MSGRFPPRPRAALWSGYDAPQRGGLGSKTAPADRAHQSAAGLARHTIRRCPDRSHVLTQPTIDSGDQIVDSPIELLGLGAGPIEIFPSDLAGFRGGIGIGQAGFGGLQVGQNLLGKDAGVANVVGFHVFISAYVR